jgi:hypothetical protein
MVVSPGHDQELDQRSTRAKTDAGLEGFSLQRDENPEPGPLSPPFPVRFHSLH